MYGILRPLLFALDPERAHKLVFGLLRATGPLARGLAGLAYGPPPAALQTKVAGLTLAGPVGLAAGLDKDGVLARFWSRCGFGFVELGTVTAHAQPGNPKPRMWRIPDAGALINRMGFNNGGSAALARRLSRLGGSRAAPLGANIGKSKITPLAEAVGDYVTSARRLASLCEYMVINVSSPNTPGLRKLQDATFLGEIVTEVHRVSERRPVFVKLAPDLSETALDEAVEVAERCGASGIIATNTTIERYGLPDPGAGGLSGAPLRTRALEVIRHVAARTELPVVGVGGIRTVSDVLETLAAGAEAVQVFSALIYEGPGLIHRLNRAVADEMKRRGCDTVADLKTSLRAP